MTRPVVKPLKVVLFGAFPVEVPAEMIRPRYRDKTEHPAGWIRLLAKALEETGEARVEIVTETRRLRRHYRTSVDALSVTYLAKKEPGRTDPFLLFIPSICRLRMFLRKIKPDIVHGFGTEQVHGIAAVRAFRPSVLMIQGIIEKLEPYLGWSSCKTFLWKWLERSAVRRATALVANTAFSASWGRGIAPSARIAVIPNICDANYFAVRPAFDEKLILCPAALSRIKGTDVLLRAFAMLGDSESRLVLFGWDMRDMDYAALARSLGIADRVIFAGKGSGDQIRSAMGHARMVVLVSRMDTSPNVVIEAHAAGLPVVGTRAGGIPDMIEDGRDGYLVEPENPEALASAMRYLLDHPEVGQRMGVAGREKVARVNNAEAVARAHLELYRAVLADFAARKSR